MCGDKTHYFTILDSTKKMEGYLQGVLEVKLSL